jgi:aryl-alcohol dehydrogenase-like predicted oxidoreductase
LNLSQARGRRVFDAARARRSLEQAEVTGRDGALGELFRIREEGLAKAVGLAAGKVGMMTPLLRDGDFDALITHNRFTLANRNDEEMLDFAQAKGIAALNAAPYAGGILAQGSSDYPATSIRRTPPTRCSIQSVASKRSARVTACLPALRRYSFPSVIHGSRRRSAACGLLSGRRGGRAPRGPASSAAFSSGCALR